MNRDLPVDVFVPYSALHAATLVVCTLAVAAPSVVARTLPAGAESLFRQTLVAAAIVSWLVYNIWWNWGGFDLRAGLPLQICDLNGLVAPLALATGRRWLRTTLYFWTAALGIQAFIQPTVTAGAASFGFWGYWTTHTITAACAVYDVAVLAFRPRLGDLGRVALVSAVYLAAVVPVNAWLGSNYGYVGNPPPDMAIPPFLAALGPWPQRAVIVVALAAAGFVVALLPWRVWGRGRR